MSIDKSEVCVHRMAVLLLVTASPRLLVVDRCQTIARYLRVCPLAVVDGGAVRLNEPLGVVTLLKWPLSPRAEAFLPPTLPHNPIGLER